MEILVFFLSIDTMMISLATVNIKRSEITRLQGWWLYDWMLVVDARQGRQESAAQQGLQLQAVRVSEELLRVLRGQITPSPVCLCLSFL